ncbi:CPBP family intramembrane glutamic endopeptidase [Actinoplanes sp. NPDC023801]|uniref:CPBP family intramembrane glutamic endopeptidase n=1 Tax=Actinoplanes sp. NPDC023801 TaxID=3154595 RepID=UPI0033D48616
MTTRLLAEHLLLFYGLTGLVMLADVPGGPIPVLVVAAGLAAAYLIRSPSFDNRSLYRLAGLRSALPGILTGWAVFSLLAAAGVAIFDRAHLFDLPRREPLLWVLLVVLYPLLSVYPQELLFRAFLMHRYATVFGAGTVAASAVAFGFAHLIFGNVLAVVLTVGGGWIFARRCQRSGSLLVVSFEHALYGITIFTVGLGRLFYHAA